MSFTPNKSFTRIRKIKRANENGKEVVERQDEIVVEFYLKQSNARSLRNQFLTDKVLYKSGRTFTAVNSTTEYDIQERDVLVDRETKEQYDVDFVSTKEIAGFKNMRLILNKRTA